MAKVMIVDDSQIMRMNLKSIFRQLGHEVVAEVENGKIAMSEYEKCLPDLITMDITMPIMNGIDATKEILKRYPEAKIVVISALNQKNMVFEALECGAKNYILKPITLEKLENVLNEVLAEENEKSNSANKENIEETEPFSMENVNGMFVLNFNRIINEKEISLLRTNLQAFFMIKPLKILMNLSAVKEEDEGFAMALTGVVDHIKKNGGKVGAVLKNREFYIVMGIADENIFETKEAAVL